jgi:hypothetical protein
MGVYEPAYKAKCMGREEFWVAHNCSYAGWCIVESFSHAISSIF